MKKLFLIISMLIFLTPLSYANDTPLFQLHLFDSDTREIKSLLNSQVRYANKTDFDKFISTYDKNYVNSDGLNLEKYSSLVKDLWDSYDNIKYGIKIQEISITDDSATVNVLETSHASIPVSSKMDGILTSEANSIYNLKKIDGKWKVSSDSVITENTSMLYGDAMDLDIKLTAPEQIPANTEYTASLEFIPPKDTIAIASIASDKVEFPQKQAKEVFRRFPEDNILERLFTSNTENLNEYVVASIGLTKADITDLSIKLSLTGFGYKITRVNVIPQKQEALNAEEK